MDRDEARAANAREPHYDPRFDPAFQRGFVAGDAPTPLPDGPRKNQRESVVDDVDVIAPDVDAEPTRVNVNGYLVLLVVIAAALVAAGAWLFTVISTSFDDPGAFRAESDYFLLQAIIILAPLAVVLGLATAIGVLFVHAVRRSRL